MHVAMVTPLPPDCDRPRGGVEAVAICLVRALVRLGVRVTVVRWGADEREPYRDAHLDCTVVPLRLRHPATLANWLWTPRELRRIVADVQPDVVHVQDIPELGLGLARPRVLTVHGINPLDEWVKAGLRRYLTVPIMGLTFMRAVRTYDHVIAISPYSRQAVRFPRRTHVHEIANPVEDRFFEVTPSEDARTVLAVGSLSKLKNTLGLVQAAGRVREAIPGVRFRIAGPWRAGASAYRRTVEGVCDRLDLHPTVDFLGPVDRAQQAAELARAGCFVLPSFQENAPMVIAEAMAAGVPVAASRVGGIPWMIDEGRTGLLFDPDDPAQIAECLIRLLTDRELRKTLGQAVRDEANRRFRADAVARRTLEVYQQAVERFRR